MSKKKPVMSHDPLAGLAEGANESPAAEANDSAQTATADETTAAESTDGMQVPAVVVLPSSLTIAEIGELYPVLSERLQQGGDLSIDCSDVDVVDGAGLQLLAALNKSAVERQVTIHWHGATDVLLRAIAELGLGDLLEVA